MTSHTRGMNRQEFAQFLGILDQLWPHNNDRPTPDPSNPQDPGSIAWRAYFDVRHPVVAHIPLGHAIQAAYALSRERRYEPPMTTFVQYAERAMGISTASGEALSWPQAQSLINAAITAHTDARDRGLTRPVRHEYLDNGAVRVTVDEDWVAPWEAAAGPIVTRFIKETGGIHRVAATWPDTTYVAQFRKWVEARSETEDVEGNLAAARVALSALASSPPLMLGDSIGAIIDGLPFELPEVDTGRRELSSGNADTHLDYEADATDPARFEDRGRAAG